MDFKAWLAEQELEEARFKGLQRLFRQHHPEMPRYVQDDLYNMRIGHTMSRLISGSGSDAQSSSGTLPTNSTSRIFKANGLHDAQWTKKPEILQGRMGEGVTPNDFSIRTREYFLERRFGYRVEPRIPNDAQRTQTQKDLMMQRGDKNEPVIVMQTMKGYDLLEGWHRTMNYLLKGCPPEQLEAVKNGEVHNMNFNSWKPVKIMAYVGRNADVARALAGTGDYKTNSTDLVMSQSAS